MTIDHHEVDQLAMILAAAVARIDLGLVPVVAKGALNIKNDARKRVEGHAHLPSYPASISYDLFVAPRDVSAEIGPDKDKPQGALGTLVEFGRVAGSDAGPIPHLLPALVEEDPRFVKALADMAEKAVLG